MLKSRALDRTRTFTSRLTRGQEPLLGTSLDTCAYNAPRSISCSSVSCNHIFVEAFVMENTLTLLPFPFSSPFVRMSSDDDAPDFSLLRRFYDEVGEARDEFSPPHLTVVSATQLPSLLQRLLVHNNNMTAVLEAFHHATLCLTVLRQQESVDDNGEACVQRWILLEKPCAPRGTDANATDTSVADGGVGVGDSSTASSTSPLLRSESLPVEFAAIHIFLANLPKSLHSDIRSGARPFGTLLREAQVRQSCSPRAFFRLDLRNDPVLTRALKAARDVHEAQRTEKRDCGIALGLAGGKVAATCDGDVTTAQAQESKASSSSSSSSSATSAIDGRDETDSYCYGRFNVMSTPEGKVIAHVIEMLPSFSLPMSATKS